MKRELSVSIFEHQKGSRSLDDQRQMEEVEGSLPERRD